MDPRTVRRALAASIAVAFAATGCGGDEGAACTEIREPLDPLSIQHVIDAESATFLTDPPTSGPHVAGPAAAGMLDSALSPAAQVRVLETGGIVVQYEAPATADDLATVLDVSGFLVALAPGDSLPAPVVATAWTWKLSCSSVDLDALRTFIDTRSGNAPGAD